MDGHCIHCEGHQKRVLDLEAQNRILFEKSEALDGENTRLDHRIDDLNDEVGAAEEMAEKAERAQDKIYESHREEKRKTLTMLRQMEFSLSVCPYCLGHAEHKIACDLKLTIWRLDHELHRTEYVHL